MQIKLVCDMLAVSRHGNGRLDFANLKSHRIAQGDTEEPGCPGSITRLDNPSVVGQWQKLGQRKRGRGRGGRVVGGKKARQRAGVLS